MSDPSVGRKPWFPGCGRPRPSEPEEVTSLDAPAATRNFRRGVRLFDDGYHWEAHQQWEAVWHVAPVGGDDHCLLRGLIRLAAAGVKLRLGSERGFRGHLLGARLWLGRVRSGRTRFVVDLALLRARIDAACAAPAVSLRDPVFAPLPVDRRAPNP